MSLKIVPVNTTIAECCKNFEQICFWDSGTYAVPENKLNGNKVIGTLGPNFYTKLCSHLHVKYSLVNGKRKKLIVSPATCRTTPFPINDVRIMLESESEVVH